jgi:branched-chain amino acid aminotransferase
MEIKILPLSKKKPKPEDESKLGFGKFFTDRMFLMEWKEEKGWHNAQIKPYEPFVLDPSALVFHYAQEIFEGLKAYKWDDGSIALFRPEKNAKRFQLSAERLSMPQVPEDLFLEALEKLIDLEQDWIPTTAGTSLYIRPAMIAVEPVLGVKPSSHYYFFIILSPVGSYYANGFNPVKIWVEDHFIRAAKGGTGEAKTGGNYAASIKASTEAKKRGFDQVLWLDSKYRRYVEEVGAMNIFFAYEDKVVTPRLNGSILAGVTRDCILQLASSFGLSAVETKVDVKVLFEDIRLGKVKEVFGSGTAAVISPVGLLSYKGESLSINSGKVGPLSQKLFDKLTSIQYGKEEDSFDWVKKVNSYALSSSTI